MGCNLSIGIKGDNTTGRTPIHNKIMPVYHEQATSPIRNERKDSSTETLPVPKKMLESRKMLMLSIYLKKHLI